MTTIEFLNILYNNTVNGTYEWKYHESLGTITSTNIQNNVSGNIYEVTLYPSSDNDIIIKMENYSRVIRGNNDYKEFTEIKNKLFNYVKKNQIITNNEISTDEDFLDNFSKLCNLH